MRRIFVLVLLLGALRAVQAQPAVTMVEHQKISREAVMHEIPFEEEVIAEAIKDTLQKLGYKGKDSKGFTVYRDVALPALGDGRYDLYISIDRKSKRQKGTSTVTMMLSKGGDNFITEKSDPALHARLKNFLSDLHYTVRGYDHAQKLAAQEEVVSETEKKIADLTEEGEDMQKKMKKLEKDIEDNKKELADQQKELEKQRQQLETLRTKG